MSARVFGRLAVGASLVLTLAAPAGAQNPPSPPPGKPAATPAGPRQVEVAVGLLWTTGRALGSLDVTETAPNGSPFVLYSVSNRQRAAIGAEVSLTRRLGSRFALEAAGSWSLPTFESRITNDFEGAASVIATQRTWEFTATGAAVVAVAKQKHGELFVRAGGGWLRQLSDDHVSYEGGWIGTVGAGVKYWWHDRAGTLPIGVRVDARLDARTGGLQISTHGLRLSPALVSLLMMRF